MSTGPSVNPPHSRQSLRAVNREDQAALSESQAEALDLIDSGHISISSSLVSMEHEMINFWNDNKIFEKLQEKNRDGKLYRFLDGPVTANNPMGVHHGKRPPNAAVDRSTT